MAQGQKGARVMSDSPSPSWYDAPEPRHELEIKREERNSGGTCDRLKCGEEIYMDVEIGDVKDRNGSFVQVCKGHYESIFEDTYEALENADSGDWEDD